MRTLPPPKIGRLSVFDALKRFYCQFSTANGGDIALTYRLTDHIDDYFDNSKAAIMSESAKINDSQVFMSGHGNRFGYEFNNECLTTIYYSLNSPGRVVNNKSRAVSRAFLSNVETQIGAMYSRGFLHGLQMKTLETGSSFMHACSFAIGQNGYIVAATPGAGKADDWSLWSKFKIIELYSSNRKVCWHNNATSGFTSTVVNVSGVKNVQTYHRVAHLWNTLKRKSLKAVGRVVDIILR